MMPYHLLFVMQVAPLGASRCLVFVSWLLMYLRLIGPLQKDLGCRSMRTPREPWHSRFPAHSGPPSAGGNTKCSRGVKSNQVFESLKRTQERM